MRAKKKVGDEVLVHCKVVGFNSVGAYVLRPLMIGHPTFEAHDGEVLHTDDVVVKFTARKRKPAR